ncbi:MAG: DUF4350 domain-containing protein [Thermodesulfovibrionales bacterium]
MKSVLYIILIALFLAPVPALPDAAETRPVVLFDQGHGQAFVIEERGEMQLSGLAGLFREAGFEVKAGRQAITPELLSGVDCLIISGPFRPFNNEEAGTIRNFIKRGGYVSVMIHITPPVISLLNEFGVVSTNGPVNEVENIIGEERKNFTVNRLDPHPLTKGLSRFSVNGTWGLQPKSGTGKVIARTSSKSWIDLNRDDKLSPGDAAQEFGVVIAGSLGRGEFAVFGDDAIFQNRFLKDENLLLGKNLVKWMLEKSSRPLSI